MSSLKFCLDRIGLKDHEAAILNGKVNDYREEGYEAHQAAVGAVGDWIKQLEDERAGIDKQINDFFGAEFDKPSLVLVGEQQMPPGKAGAITKGKKTKGAEQGGLEFAPPETPTDLVLTGEKAGPKEAEAAKKILDEAKAAPAAKQAAAIADPKAQVVGTAEKNVAKLIHQLGIQAEVMQGDDFHLVIKRAPYLDLVIERHLDGNGIPTLYLTHYIHDESSGDTWIDSEMVYSIAPNGELGLVEVAVQNVTQGGELRRYDRAFANVFARNVLAQGFGNKWEHQVGGAKTETPLTDNQKWTIKKLGPVGSKVQYVMGFNQDVMTITDIEPNLGNVAVDGSDIYRSPGDFKPAKTGTDFDAIRQTLENVDTGYAPSGNTYELLQTPAHEWKFVKKYPNGEVAYTSRTEETKKKIIDRVIEDVKFDEKRAAENEAAEPYLEPTTPTIDNADEFINSKPGDIVHGYEILARQIDRKSVAKTIAQQNGGEVIRDVKKGSKDTWAVWRKAPIPGRIEIGDTVKPKEGSSLLPGSGGRVQHIKTNEDGRRRIKTENSGNYFYESDWDIVEKAKVEETPDEDTTAKDEAPTSAYGGAVQQLAKWVQDKIRNRPLFGKTGPAFTWQELFDAADQRFGGTQAQGKYTVKDAYDAMELGVNFYLDGAFLTADPTVNAESAKQIVTALKLMIEGLPTQTKRTQEQQDFQQFSTPPPLAFMVNWALNLRDSDVYLEPSAGIGGIAIFAMNAGVEQVYANELSPRRAEILRSLPFTRVFTENAEQLNNILPAEVKPTVIGMNPPFSATGGRLKNNQTKYGAQHIEQALARLQPGGRLVAIVGQGMADSAPAFRDWWKRIKARYNVLANISISGEEYRKYGTTFDNQILVIDKTGQTAYDPLTGRVEKIEELVPLLEGVRNARTATDQSETSQRPPILPGLPSKPERPQLPGGGLGTVPGPTTDLGGGQSQAGPGTGVPGRDPDDVVGGPGQTGAEPKAGGTEAAGEPGGERGPDGGRIPGPDIGDSSGRGIDDIINGLIDLSNQEADKAAQREKEASTPTAPEDRSGGALITRIKIPKPAPGLTPKERETGKTKAEEAQAKIEAARKKFNDLFASVKETPEEPGIDKARWPAIHAALSEMWNGFKDMVGSIKEAASLFIKDAYATLSSKGRAYVNKFIQEDVRADLANEQQINKDLTPPTAINYTDQGRNTTISQQEIEDSLFSNYEPRVKIPGAQPHPSLLVQSVAMADTELPDPTYKFVIPLNHIENGNISEAQLEVVVYANQSFEVIFPDGRRRGFMVGDGTGVGKGREIASVIYDNYLRGRKKAVWISEKPELMNDAKRDLYGEQEDEATGKTTITGIGWKKGQEILFKTPPGKKGEDGVTHAQRITKDEGILFVSYAALRGGFDDYREDQRDARNNIDIKINQIVDWLGADFDGVVAFDESHNMRNIAPQAGERGSTAAAKMAMAGVELQRRLPNARILYVSATGAVEVENLIYADRLGLWGEGTAFSTSSNFLSELYRAGMAGMEMIARDLKSRGLYVSRSLSYHDVEYDRMVHNLDAEQQAIYDEVARAWQIVFQNVNTVVREHTGGKKQNTWSIFWGAQQRFFESVVTSMQMPTVLRNADQDLENGNSVIFQLTKTGNAQAKRGVDNMVEGDELEDLDLSPKEVLINFLNQYFPVQQYEDYTDENGNPRKRPVYDSNNNPVLNAEAVAMRDEMLARVGSITGIPTSPLDMIVQHFGQDKVAEVTSREFRFVYDDNGKLFKEKWSKAKAMKDVSNFMGDKKRVLIFSEAGGTGASYHASKDHKNQTKRIHYLLQSGWNAVRAVQGLGRSHRSNQRQAPKFFLVTTDIKGQARFISTIARRLDQLGALTKGQRQTGSQGIFQARDNLENEYARSALVSLLTDIRANAVQGIDPHEFQNATGIKLFQENPHTGEHQGPSTEDFPETPKFLNRALALELEAQNRLFDEFFQRIDQVITQHAEAGTLDVGIETISGLSVRKASEQDVHTDELTGAKTKYVRMEVQKETHHIPWEDSGKLFRYPEGKPTYYRNIKSGRIWVGSNQRSRSHEGRAVLYKTMRGPAENANQNVDNTVLEDKKRWEVVETDFAGGAWKAEFNNLPLERTETHHLLTAPLLPIWDRLLGDTRIYRMQTDEGERYLGRVIPEVHLAATLENLGVGIELKKYEGYEVHQAILNGGTAKLVNGWELKKSLVSGDDRIEITGPGYMDFQALKKMGIFSELIQSKTRYFIPTDESGEEIIGRIIRHKEVKSLTKPYAGPILASVKEDDNFKLWFRDSKVVDEDGNPKVVYHGTESDFDVFDTQPTTRAGRNTSFDPISYLGTHFAEGPEVADVFNRSVEPEAPIGGRTIPAYLKISNPLEATEDEIQRAVREEKLEHPVLKEFVATLKWGKPVGEGLRSERPKSEEAFWKRYNASPEFRRMVFSDITGSYADDLERAEMNAEVADSYQEELISKYGHDGIKYANSVEGGTSWIAFKPNQIKSIFNRKFDPNAKAFMASMKEGPQFNTSQEAIVYGKTATKEQVAELQGLYAEAKELSASLIKSQNMDDFDEAMRIATLGQFYREALESASGANTEVVRQIDEWIKNGAQDRDLMASMKASDSVWYSQMEEHLEEKLPGSGTPQSLLNLLATWAKSGAIKSEEYEWSTVRDFLEDFTGEKITKAAIMEYLRENNVQVNEQIMGGYFTPEQIMALEDYLDEVRKVENLRDTGGQISSDAAQDRITTLRENLMGEQELTWEDIQHFTGFGETVKSRPTKYGPDKYPDLSLKGGTGHRELLLTLPDRITLPSGWTVTNEKERKNKAISDWGWSKKDQNNWWTVRDDEGEIRAQGYNDKQTAIQQAARNIPTFQVGYSETYGNATPNDENFFTGHYPNVPNILAHVRFNERVDYDGKKVLFIEEVQSDWHEKAFKLRKAEIKRIAKDKDITKAEAAKLVPKTFGYKIGDKRADKAYNKIWDELSEKYGGSQRFMFHPDFATEDAQRLNEASAALDAAKNANKKGVPDAPFKNSWNMLVLKRMVRWASENGFDKLAWTPGSVQNARYDLSKHISKIEYEKIYEEVDKSEGSAWEGMDDEEIEQLTGESAEPEFTGRYELVVYDKHGERFFEEEEIDIERVEEIVGKELAERIEKDEGEDFNEFAQKTLGEERPYRNWKVLSGLDLKVGGEGMIGFYDVIMVADANRIFNKPAWGNAKVEYTQLGSYTLMGGRLDMKLWDKTDSYAVAAHHAGKYGNEYVGYEGEDGEIKSLEDLMDETGFTPDEEDTERAASRFLQYYINRGYEESNLRIAAPEVNAPTIPITPQMRERSIERGVPMFSVKRMSPVARTYLDALKEAVPDQFVTSQDNANDPYANLDPAIREKIEKARGLGKPKLLTQKKREGAELWHSMTRHRPFLDPSEYATLADVLRTHQETPENSVRRALQVLQGITGGLKPKQYEIFSLKLLMDDMMKDVDSGLLGGKEKLPFGFTEDSARQYRDYLADIAGKDPIISAAIERRTKFQEKLRSALVEADLLPKSVLDDDRYFHHQVLKYRAIKDSGEVYEGLSVGAKDARLHKKGWQIGRIGSVEEYNTEYVQAEFEVISQGFSQLETKAVMNQVQELTDITPRLKAQAKQENLDRFYEEEAARQTIPGQPPITADMIMNSPDDPLKPFAKSIAMAFSGLRKLAKDGKLMGGPEWKDVMDYLGGKRPTANQPLLEQSRLWGYMGWVQKNNHPGAMQVGTIRKAISDRAQFIKGSLGDRFVTPKSLMPENYQEWAPKPGQTWYKAYSLSDRIVAAVQAGETTIGQANADQIKRVLARGKDAMWIVPKDVAKTLDGFDIVQSNDVIAKGSRAAMNAWKQWVLINPFRVIKYNINNLSGDLDIAIAYDPKILTYLKQAVADLTKEFRGKQPLSKALRKELELAYTLGVMDSGWSMQEVSQIVESLSVMKHMEMLQGNKPNVIKRTWRNLKGFTRYRENWLRLAAFRYFRDEIAAGRNPYGASKPAEIDAIASADRRAAKLSRELIGDYGNLTHAGQFIRRHVLPFYAWMEINSPRYIQLMKNLKHEGRGGGRAGTVIAGKMAWQATKLGLKMAGFFTMVNLWNMTFFPDLEDELGESERRQMHLILGRNRDGSVRSMRIQGAFSDFLDWVDMADVIQDYKAYRAGKKSIKDIAKDSALAAPTKIINALRPDVKTGAEIISGQSWYPDPFNPRPIRDSLEHIARMFSMGSLYDWIAGKPKRGDTVGKRIANDLMALGFYNSDPGQNSYYDTIAAVGKWREAHGKEQPGIIPTDKSNALYYYKQGLKYGDLGAAEKYLRKYFELGGTHESLGEAVQRAHPLGGIAQKDRKAFLMSLSPGEIQSYQRAVNWYNQTYKSVEAKIVEGAARRRPDLPPAEESQPGGPMTIRDATKLMQTQ